MPKDSKRRLSFSATGTIPKTKRNVTVRAVVHSGTPPLSPSERLRWIPADELVDKDGRPVNFNPNLVYWQDVPDSFDAPIVVDGTMCPAWFVVEGLPNRIAFYCEPVIREGDDLAVFGATRIIVDALKPNDGTTPTPVVELDRAPITTLVDLAVKAAAVRGVADPAGDDGPLMDLRRGKLVSVGGRIVTRPGDRFTAKVIASGRHVTPLELRSTTGRGEWSKLPVDPAILPHVAAGYANVTPGLRDKHGRTITRDGQVALYLAERGYVGPDGRPYSASNVRNNLRPKAIAAGYKIEVRAKRQSKGGKK